MAFYKYVGPASEHYPTLGLTARPGQVYDFGSFLPPTEDGPNASGRPVTNYWVSDAGPATDYPIAQASDLVLRVQKITTGTAATQTRPSTDPNVTVWWLGSDATHPPVNAMTGDVWDHS